MTRKEEQGDPHNLLELDIVWKVCQQFRVEIRGEVVSFLVDKTTTLSYLQKEGDSLLRIPTRCSGSESRHPVQGKRALEWSLGSVEGCSKDGEPW